MKTFAKLLLKSLSWILIFSVNESFLLSEPSRSDLHKKVQKESGARAKAIEFEDFSDPNNAPAEEIDAKKLEQNVYELARKRKKTGLAAVPFRAKFLGGCLAAFLLKMGYDWGKQKYQNKQLMNELKHIGCGTAVIYSIKDAKLELLNFSSKDSHGRLDMLQNKEFSFCVFSTDGAEISVKFDNSDGVVNAKKGEGNCLVKSGTGEKYTNLLLPFNVIRNSCATTTTDIKWYLDCESGLIYKFDAGQYVPETHEEKPSGLKIELKLNFERNNELDFVKKLAIDITGKRINIIKDMSHRGAANQAVEEVKQLFGKGSNGGKLFHNLSSNEFKELKPQILQSFNVILQNWNSSTTTISAAEIIADFTTIMTVKFLGILPSLSFSELRDQVMSGADEVVLDGFDRVRGNTAYVPRLEAPGERVVQTLTDPRNRSNINNSRGTLCLEQNPKLSKAWACAGETTGGRICNNTHVPLMR